MIRFDSVTKTYRGTARPALDDLSLEILKGEFVFLVGASGSGKSSFLRLVLKEEKPSKGQIHVLGQQLNSLPSRKVPYFRRSLGVVFQDFRLLPQKTVFDNVAFTLQVIGKSKGFIQEAVPDVLKLVGLAGKQGRFPHELSGGEQQRVAIARAVVNKPAILLADEPTGNLDPATSAGIMSLLSSINANGTTVLMATHDAGIVDQMQRRVIELVAGRVVRDERGGGYQTQAIPVQDRDAAAAPEPARSPRAGNVYTAPVARAAAVHPVEDAAASTPSPAPTQVPAQLPAQPAAVQAQPAAPVARPAAAQTQPAAARPAAAQPAAAQPAAAQPAAAQPAAAQPAAAQPAAAQPADVQSALASAVARATQSIQLPGRETPPARRDEQDGGRQ